MSETSIPAGTGSTAAPTSSLAPTHDRTLIAWLLFGGAGAAVLGVFLPWASGPFGLTVNGISTDDGPFLLVVAMAMLALAAVAVRADKWWKFTGAMGILGLVVSAVEIVWDSIPHSADVLGTSISIPIGVGFGLVVSALGCAVFIAGASLGVREERSRLASCGSRDDVQGSIDEHAITS